MLTREGRNWRVRTAGVAFLLLPHLIGAPTAMGQSAIPAQLLRRFAVTSLATTGMFWLLLGTVGGFISSRNEAGCRLTKPT